MLTSLFGDLSSSGRARSRAPEEPDQGFAATAILESVATEVNERGQMVDRHLHDLVVSGSPAQAIREHFAATRADLDKASRLITLLDPVGIWASAVVKALSDAGGQPIERLHLRERNTLRTLAMIERTTLLRRQEDPLRILHADVRVPGPENAEIPVALMERSHMTTVIVGTMQPHAVDALLRSLRDAASLPTWRCPNLLFMLPPGAIWIANHIAAVAWPSQVHVHVLSEPLTSASAVWNAMLGMWNHVKSQPDWEPAPAIDADFPVRVAEIGVAPPPPALRVSRLSLDAERARAVLSGLLALDGLLGCAVVDASNGVVLAREARDNPPLQLDQAAAVGAQVLRAHRQALRGLALPDPVDEIITSAGPRQQVLRTLARHGDLFLIALLDKQRTNLALVRYRLMEAEKSLS